MMATLERAIEIAHIAHEGEFRRNREPYVTHPLAVMTRAEKLGYSVTRRIIAVLHDVPENNPHWPIERIEGEGYGDDVVQPLRLLTRGKDVDYFDYIETLSDDPDATAIKILDMEHNLDDNPTERQVTKYQRALAFLAAKYAA